MIARQSGGRRVAVRGGVANQWTDDLSGIFAEKRALYGGKMALSLGESKVRPRCFSCWDSVLSTFRELTDLTVQYQGMNETDDASSRAHCGTQIQNLKSGPLHWKTKQVRGCGMLWFQNLQLPFEVSLMPSDRYDKLFRERQLLFIQIKPVLHIPVLYRLLNKSQTSQTLVARFQSLQDSKMLLHRGKPLAHRFWIVRPPSND